MSVMMRLSSDMMLGLLAITITTLATFISAAPEAKEGRGLMDEALKKFYFDLYDQDISDPMPVSPSPGLSEGHSFKFDDYFDTGNNDNLATIVTPAAIVKKKDSIGTPNRNTKLAPFPLPPPRNSPRLPVAPSQSQVTAPASPVSSSQDPTFVLSRLLFHLSQLPSS